MDKNLEKIDWRIDLKGYFPEMVREAFSGEYFSDLVYGTRTINFIGTKEELDIYIDKITGKESQLKVIGILNNAETLVEFRRVFDFSSIETGEILISDVFNSKSWTLPSYIATNLIPEEERIKFIESLKDNPTRRFIPKDYLEEFINSNLKK
jgi:hypothetical protein